MRIVHVSYSDTTGGAAKSAYRLHRSLVAGGQSSVMYVRAKNARRDDVIQFQRPAGLVNMVRRIWRNSRVLVEDRALGGRPRATLEMFSNVITKFGDQVGRALPECDVVNLHWVAGFIDLTVFFRHVRQPVVWTLHDMNAFTGGCHYDQGCGKFAQACGACPQLRSARERDYSRRALARKVQAFRQLPQMQMVIVTPSRWLAAQVGASPLLSKFDTRVVPYGIDTETYTPRDAGCLRQALGISEGERVVLFVAEQLCSYRKGLDLVEAACSRPGQQRVVLVCVGETGTYTESGRVRVVPVRTINNEAILSLFYSLADVLVCGSRQDNLPNAVIEALACGAPVVAFDVGGLSDIVIHKANGWLAPPFDIESLAQGINWVVSDRERSEQLRRNARASAVERYSEEMISRKYTALYEELLSK